MTDDRAKCFSRVQGWLVDEFVREPDVAGFHEGMASSEIHSAMLPRSPKAWSHSELLLR